MSDDGVATVAEVGGEDRPASAVAVPATAAPEEATTLDSKGAVENGGELTVIYSDEDIAVLDKPSGLRTVPGRVVGPEAKTRAHVRLVYVYALCCCETCVVWFVICPEAAVGHTTPQIYLCTAQTPHRFVLFLVQNHHPKSFFTYIPGRLGLIMTRRPHVVDAARSFDDVVAAATAVIGGLQQLVCDCVTIKHYVRVLQLYCCAAFQWYVPVQR